MATIKLKKKEKTWKKLTDKKGKRKQILDKEVPYAFRMIQVKVFRQNEKKKLKNTSNLKKKDKDRKKLLKQLQKGKGSRINNEILKKNIMKTMFKKEHYSWRDSFDLS